ncbi:MAG: hypothetical protein QM610_02960 [Chitinophagaceae bacterium]
MKKFIVVFSMLTGISAYAQKADYEVFATVEQSVGNIAFTAKGDLVYSHHPFFNPKFRVVKYNAKVKTTTLFPNKEWNTPRETDDHYLSNVLGIRNDENGIVWLLDMAQRNPVTPKIVGWNTITDQLERIYYLPETSVVSTSQPNDMIVDTKHNVFFNCGRRHWKRWRRKHSFADYCRYENRQNKTAVARSSDDFTRKFADYYQRKTISRKRQKSFGRL